LDHAESILDAVIELGNEKLAARFCEPSRGIGFVRCGVKTI